MFDKIRLEHGKHVEREIYKKRITRNFKDLKIRRKLTKQQRKEIQDFYQKLIGRKVPLYSHEYFYSRTGVFSKEYIPTNLYHCELLGKANMLPFGHAYGDKNMCDILFPGENLAHTILKNMNGYYYWEGEPITKEGAVKRCWNIDDVILKPTMEYSGKGVQMLTVKNGTTSANGVTIDKLFEQYDKNFLIQRCVKQHERMSALNPTSVNTMRILTYRSGMEILVIYSVVRIGHLGSSIDNQCAGGISTTISEEGRLGKFAFGGYCVDNIEKTDTGVVLDGYQLPSYDKAIEFVKRLHYKLPFFNLVGWDVAIEENGNPILIEWNYNPGLSQSAFCSGMGKYTERFIKEVWPRVNSKHPNW